MNRINEIETRLAEIRGLLDQPDADLNALREEIRALQEEREQLRARAATQEELRQMVANGAGQTIERSGAEQCTSRTVDEIRNSQEYIDAFARYIRSGDPRECRSMLTENASSGGQIVVPTFVDQIVRTAWENDQILSRVKKSHFKGNFKCQFEISADPAVVHLEGTAAPAEEDLQLGVVTMIPSNVKKWIQISDEAVAIGGQQFLEYIYSELTHQIIRKLSGLVIADITGAAAAHSKTAIGIPTNTAAPSLTAIPTAMGYLSDEASNPVVIINRLTYVDFVAAHAAGNFAVDPFAGLKVLYTSALPAYSAASSGDVYAIVGDLDGAQVNYPEGEGVVIKYDDLTNAQADMVKVVGRQYAAHAVTGPGRFSRLAKA